MFYNSILALLPAVHGVGILSVRPKLWTLDYRLVWMEIRITMINCIVSTRL